MGANSEGKLNLTGWRVFTSIWVTDPILIAQNKLKN